MLLSASRAGGRKQPWGLSAPGTRPEPRVDGSGSQPRPRVASGGYLSVLIPLSGAIQNGDCNPRIL